MNILYIIIPCYNEETVLPITSKLFLSKLNSLIESGKISNNSRILGSMSIVGVGFLRIPLHS